MSSSVVVAAAGAAAATTTTNPGIAGSNLLPGKIVAITGASRGIGRACALACAAHGAKGIIIHYLSDTQTTAEAHSLTPTRTHPARHALHPRPWRHLRPNCGPNHRQHSRNLLQPPRRVHLQRGHLPLHGFPRDGTFQSHYTPTRAGLRSMMESAAIGLGPLGVRCNSVLPGTIETAINKEDLMDGEKRKRLIDRHPLKRLGRPEDIAGPVVFLASDLAQFMTGSSVLVDGGYFVNLQ